MDFRYGRFKENYRGYYSEEDGAVVAELIDESILL